MMDIRGLSDDYVVIDLDTGTVLNTNLLLVDTRQVTTEGLDILNQGSDSEICDIGQEFGVSIYKS